jgi:hypothetical protein
MERVTSCIANAARDKCIMMKSTMTYQASKTNGALVPGTGTGTW